ncbi:DotU family type IV/VI secretion system protein, partial [Pseudomonas aeruginosa]
MIKEREYHEDEKTVLLDHQGQVPAQGPLTDFAEPPRFEQLEERMIYAARLRPGEAFNVSLNPLVAAGFVPVSEVGRLKHSNVLGNP